jgi:protein-glucosylgalactosylhydroxylysine glucosidase
MLLIDSVKNTYPSNGHNRQETADALPLYLPGNGSLLLAVAMMAGGWDGSEGLAPGFPGDGSWQVEHEGLGCYL